MKYEYKNQFYAGSIAPHIGSCYERTKKSNVAEAVKLLGVCQSKLAETESELQPLIQTEGVTNREDL